MSLKVGGYCFLFPFGFFAGCVLLSLWGLMWYRFRISDHYVWYDGPLKLIIYYLYHTLNTSTVGNEWSVNSLSRGYAAQAIISRSLCD